MIYDLSSCSRKSEREIMTLQCPSFYVAKCWDLLTKPNDFVLFVGPTEKQS